MSFLLTLLGLVVICSTYLLLIGLKLEGNLPTWSWFEVFLLPIAYPVVICIGVICTIAICM